ncbi:site-specific integrase [Niallia taxi]|uniref:site-specific integrase n=1 Tax=Niallia taxi TaxID=2499688 RepID=UPI00300964DF
MTDIKFDEKRNSYYFVYDAGRDPITNKRKQIRRTGFKTVTEAKRMLKDIIANAEKLKLTPTNLINLTFEEYASKWIQDKKISLQHSTYTVTMQNLKNNVYPYIGHVRLKEFNQDILQSYINELTNKISKYDKKMSPHTVHRIWSYVREVLYKASKKKIIDLDIMDDLYLPALESNVSVWQKHDIERFLNAYGNVKGLSRHYIGIAISVLTGMRMGEVLGLRWKDVDFENRTFTIRQTLVLKEGGGVYSLEPRAKTKFSKATFVVPNRLIEMLMNHKKLIEADKQRHAKVYCDNDLIVCSRYGTYLNPANFRKYFKHTIKLLDLPYIRFHDLRHTHATFLISSGVNPKVVQERLRHKDIKTTLGTYSHALPQMHNDAIDKFEDL